MLQETNLANVVAPTSGAWGSFQAVTGSFAARAVNGGSTTTLGSTTNLQIQVLVRRVCTSDTNPSRRAWCCTAYTRTATFTNVSGTANDGWPVGSTSGDFGGGTAPVNGSECDSPAP